MHNYILAVFVIKSRKVKFYAGTTAIKQITTLEHNKILTEIKYYMTTGEYYKAWTRMIEDYDYYYNNYNGNINTNTKNNKNKISKETNPYDVLLCVLIIAAIIIICIFCNIKGWCDFSSSNGYNNNKKSYNRHSGNYKKVSYGREADNRVRHDRGRYGGRGSVASGGGGGSW